MATTTEFESWIDNNVEDINDAYCLKQAIENRENWGSYDVSVNGDKIFVKAFDETLMLASVKAQETFLSMLEQQFADEGLDIESTYDFYRQMEKDD